MPFARDPLSERYDAAARRLISRATAKPGRWAYTVVARPRPGPQIIEWLRSKGLGLEDTDDGGLTTYQRAFQRSVYWNVKHHSGKPWSLQREWGPVTPRGRTFGIRASDPGVAYRAMRRKPSRVKYVGRDMRVSG
jgi:hypothetical protein